MEKQIKELNEYFVNLLLAEEYEIVKITKYTANVIVLGKYHFVLWISNGYEWLRSYEGDRNFMELTFTAKQKKILYKRFYNIYKTECEVKEIEDLEARLNQLKSNKNK